MMGIDIYAHIHIHISPDITIYHHINVDLFSGVFFWISHLPNGLTNPPTKSLTNCRVDLGHLELRLGGADFVGRLQAVPEPTPRFSEGRSGAPWSGPWW